MAQSFPEAGQPLRHDQSTGISEKARSLCHCTNCPIVDSVAQEEWREGLALQFSTVRCSAGLVGHLCNII